MAPLIRTHGERLELEWLERHGIHTVADLLAIGPEDIATWSGFGVTKVERLSMFTRRLDAAATDLLGKRLLLDGSATQPKGAALLLADSVQDLTSLVGWARLSSGAVTVGDLVRCLAAGVGPEDVVDSVRQILESPLPPVDLDPLGDLRSWIGTLDARDRVVLERRLVRFENSTLDEIGSEFGVTRERIRQLEGKLKGRLQQWLSSDDGRSVRWALHLLDGGLGACAPDSEVPLVGEDGGHSEEFGLLLYLADMVWERDEGVIRRRNFVWPVIQDIPLVDGGPVVAESGLRALLQSRGVVNDHLEWAVGQVQGLNRHLGILVVWPANMVDQSIAVLCVSGVPMSDTEIAHRLDRDISVRGLRNRLMEDDRFRRVTKSDFALTAWGLPEYGGIVASMVQRLEDQGSCTVGELARYLEERHSINAGSVSAYASAPIFIREGDLLRIRRADEPYTPSLNISDVKGLYRLGPRKFVWHLPVDHDLLRGSGRFCPSEVATAIGVYPGRSETLATPIRDIRITWTATTHMGPTISSLRAHAEELRADKGDRLRIVVDGAACTADVSLAPKTLGGAEGIAELLEIAPDGVATSTSLIEQLGRSMDVAPEEVERKLRQRGDDEIADVVGAALNEGALT
ncbi:sigma factor-like helix-turn-helix DNA-binding protein [Phycicoccus sp. Soil803]|uniref:sigma factor-like helix-turn-helix DNA-binding protein n=1 Tax=Phycicoccus sp. Soil803 TaxID=1736415 RepID=UPI0007111EE7|nr:sigma factor-like helix-turn-helix DNA-binding protein [Phycicoccus sp. Soil803]